MKRMSNRIISVLLAVMMLLPILPSSLIAMAAAGTPTLRVSSVLGRVGDTVTVSVTISENSYVCGGNFNLVYDSTKLQVISATCGDVVSGMTPIANPQYDSNKVRFTFAGITPVTEFGILLTVTVKILAGASREAAVSLEKVNLYDSNSTAMEKNNENGAVIIDGEFLSPILSTGD